MKVVLLSLITLVSLCLALNWQASGRHGWNGTPGSDDEPNLPRLEVELDQAVLQLDHAVPMNVVANTTSQDLNELWDPSWNVVICETSHPIYDIVLYGYAFRNHWAWYNRYKGSVYSFVVWKDYKCDDLVINFDKNDATQEHSVHYASLFNTTNIKTQLEGIPLQGDLPDLWASAKVIVEGGEDGTHLARQMSAVVMLDEPTRFAATFCGASTGFIAWTFNSIRPHFTRDGFEMNLPIYYLAYTAGLSNYRAGA